MTAISKAIDPGRAGLSKSLMCTPCERKGLYSETVRDERGWRLRFPMPEKVTFGSAVDEAVTYIVYHDREGEPWNFSDALALGMETAREKDPASWALVEDQATFHVQLANALQLYLDQPDGLARIRALYPEHLRLQGDNGRSLRAGDVIGTPDFMTDRRVVDLKTWGRNDGVKKMWTSPEMGVYAYLFAAESGAIPETVAYQAYIRVSKPYWIWLEVPGTSALVDYGRETANHWRALLEAGRPELAAANPMFCGDCPWAAPMPEVGHDGCAVGRLMPREDAA